MSIEQDKFAQLDAAQIARLSIHEPAGFAVQYPQTLHRVELVRLWKIPLESKVLELGCGQGDCTTVLATAVGKQGKVVAVDPAPPDYGSPYTVGEAQQHISRGPLGKQITWVQQSPLHYLSSHPSGLAFDATVLAHCLWYFHSPAVIIDTFRAVKQHSKRLLLAEWSLLATNPHAQPHVLAALTQAALECRKSESTANVRTVLSPNPITELAIAAGWQLEDETVIQVDEGMLDGRWEVDACLSDSFQKEVEEKVSNQREAAVVLALRDACEASVKAQGGRKEVRGMDVWVSSFV